MANEHKNDELQQPSDGNSPSSNANGQSDSETTKLCSDELVMEPSKVPLLLLLLTNTITATTTTTTATPDLGLGIETNSNSNCSNNAAAAAGATTTTTQTERPCILSTTQQPVPGVGTMRKSATTTAAPTQNASSTFSFKHFLSSSSSTFTAPSTTVTSLDPICSLAASTTTSTASTTITASNGGTQKSTGARPKVPQSASLAIDAICGNRVGGGGMDSVGLTMPGSSDIGGGSGSGSGAFGIGSTRMKRSPRFSSFDSQASLAEYVAAGSAATCNSNRPNRLSLHPTLPYASNGPLGTQHVGAEAAACAGMDLQMDKQPGTQCPSATSLPHISSFRGAIRRSNQNLTTNSAHKLDLPIDSAAANILGPSDFPSASASAAAALPDFVQDHWMDTLYLHDMHLNSPRSSPAREFSGAMASGTGGNVPWSDLGAIGGGNSANSATGGINIGCDNSAVDGGGVCSGGNGVGGGIAAASSTSGSSASKMLPDFLSDGPIIHSSQRLADVAAGLPSNSVGSPEDPPITSQLSGLRLENERLQRELSELRTALCEQTRRANDLERQIEEDNRRRTVTPTAQQMLRLKQQLAEVTEEAEILRRENETLREEGAVGGLTETANTGQRSDGGFVRPISSTRSQQISQALLRAASNAENNLRQLLAGVDNLRQMAADIEGPGLRLDYDGNSDIYSDFLDDCDGFEDFSGGPAL